MVPVSTDPNDWFLTDRGLPESELSIFTSNNLVEPLVDGGLYMQRIHDLLVATTPGDYVFIAGWRMDADQQMILGSAASRVDTVFIDSHGRGVELRVMLSNHVGQGNAPIQKQFNKAGILCIRDARHPTYGSAHQKFASISRAGTLHAFCGGIDLAHDRWDTPMHPSSPARQFDTFVGGWHDNHCYIQGPACRDLDLTFRERWNDPRRPRVGEGAPPLITLPFPSTPAAGPHHVQILRTYACDNGYPFAARGEFTARNACLKAIGMARDYIYIEDQYFVSYEIAAALEAALLAQPNLRVIVLVPRAPDAFVAPFNYHQNELINRLMAAAPTRFAIYHLENITAAHAGEQVYVHAKTMIVDDVWAQIGSMNCNRRSMTHDAEVCAAVVDSTIENGVCKFARDLRLTLWAEHLFLGQLDPSIADPVTGFATWAARAATSGVMAKVHTAATPRRDRAWNIADPQGICPGDPRIPPP